jgi:hypothetical protein
VYLDELTDLPRVAAWMLLEHVRHRCVPMVEAATSRYARHCSDLEAQTVGSATNAGVLDLLCDEKCSWPFDLPKYFGSNFGMGLATDKPLFCARRFDGTYCRAAISRQGTYEQRCELLSAGCARPYREHLFDLFRQRCSRLGRPSSECTAGALDELTQTLANCTQAHTAQGLASLLPPEFNYEQQFGHLPSAHIWRAAADVLGWSVPNPPGCPRPTNWCLQASETYDDSVDCDGDGLPDPHCMDVVLRKSGYISSASACTNTWPSGFCADAMASVHPDTLEVRRRVHGASFTRVTYPVLIGGKRFRSSGLWVEPTGSLGSARGVIIWFHGSETSRGQCVGCEATNSSGESQEEALSRAVTSSARLAMLALLSQLGLHVLAPDGLGLGSSSAPHQAYLDREHTATVAVEMLRGLHSSLSLRGSGAWPAAQVWLLGGSHGGFVAAATQRLLQRSHYRRIWRVVGSFMHAPPLDVSGAMLRRLLEPYPNPWIALLIAKSIETYHPGELFDVKSSLYDAGL